MSGETKKNGMLSHAKLIQRIVGAVITVLGAVLFVIGLVFLKNETPYWFVMFIGLSVAVTGAFLFVFGFQRENAKYVMTDHLGESEYAPSASDESAPSAVIACECGEINPAESLFCKKCGRSLRRTCGKCGASVPSDAVFCDKCGEKLVSEK